MIGDIGGHRAELLAALVGLGVDPDELLLPADLTVVQIGDLVHRGPDSLGVLELVADLMERNGSRWVQLAGNHEAQYLGRHTLFEWHERLAPVASRMLRDWWADGRMVMAAAITSPGGDHLATHAGLTQGFWEQVLDGPGTAPYAARALNGLVATKSAPVLFHGGVVLTGKVDETAGPIWAAAGEELAVSWLDADTELPFHQVHGHSSVRDWTAGRWRAPMRVQKRTVLDADARHTTVTLGRHRIVGVDPVLGREGGVRWAPYVIPGGSIVR
ncbi:metallophosphoesterase [Nakamurella flavida]|uniref:Metallophosphoesterase n=1 Tax=Nakamurella flavida TaxID=363630 RepID=A0A938YLC9_9ACTN|nr:metallophosphoesterase [Nakamurella flavida]